MARKVRIQYPGAIYHVMNRGDRREAIFEDDEDRERLLEALTQACQKTGWQAHAYCLMRSHFHLVLETPQPNLVVGMKWLLGTYTSRYNRRHKISLAQGEGTLGEIRLKQRALDHRGHPRLPARRAIIFRTPSASWAVQAVTGPSKPFSTSRCSHSMRRCRSSCASSSRRPSRTTSVADPYAPLFTFSATKCLCRAVNATFITDVSLA
jgi:REP element-mobilizing transposase RayT